MGNHRPAGERVHHFWQIGTHTRPLPGGKHHYG